jgi:predicted transcriptional regulator
MEELANLFFELSHVDRLDLLVLLSETPGTLTEFSEKISISTQEVYRHLSRLQKVKLVNKTVEGDYKLTHLGEDLILWLPGFRFLQNNREYFTQHSLNNVPTKFRLRIGELSKAEPVDQITVAVNNIERMIEGAEEYVCIISDQIIMSTIDGIMNNLENGISMRTIEPEGFQPRPDFLEQYTEKQLETYHRSKLNKVLKEATISEVPLVLYLSENEVGFIGFSDHDNRIDFLGFSSTDEEAHVWCLELFEDIWRRSNLKPVSS